ncbi:T9SS type A sorting domain-containing protein [Lacinutrix sp. C3R15]|uniref:T9SS type A sorting domain-containing protein n=1 Tax=Flavobacteriaceae TaxID=49546 RepID=UPI001C093934|nr:MULTISPECIES: T9SS type A sorting domain-containing protein [Flavobacteriaceae]MBU2939105.1 T9SS type A sorting domain-containing protein [Lacinutrix sp. C3R15]MDO6622420.1 T9SS type A sorting domain-containing protein [Oceanihabitans sp. 1_MG-2023]
MKKIYTLLFLCTTLYLNAQTTVNYSQRQENYQIVANGAGVYDDGTENLGMWANYDAKEVVGFRNFTETGLPGGTASTMAIGDSFTITLSATRAYGQIGVALLSSPTSTATWLDRHNNYAVQVNMNGNGGSYDPIEVVSNAGTVNVSTISGSTTYADFKFTFTLQTATTMLVSINDGADSFAITLNNTNITGYSIYLADDWNGSANANIYWKPTSEYVYATTLSASEFSQEQLVSLAPNPTNNSFKINKEISNLKIFDITGKLVKTFSGDYTQNTNFSVSDLSKGIYLVKIKNMSGQISTTKLVKI